MYNVFNENMKKVVCDGNKCLDQMWEISRGIIEELEKYYNDDFTDEERENGEDYIGYYFEGALDVNYLIGSNGDYLGCKICVAWGGPGIWLDTCDGLIKCRWWGDNLDFWLDRDLCNIIDDCFSEYYDMTR